MMRWWAAGLWLGLSLMAKNEVPRDTQQAVVVTSAGWDAVRGTLQRYERVKGEWQRVGEPVAVVVGRSGMAWGRGVVESKDGLQKKEGDGRSPAGVFGLGTLFGQASKELASEQKFLMPYTAMTANHQCVDDPSSRYYNQIVDRSRLLVVDWHSAEEMLLPGGAYKWGAVVEHNVPAKALGGSCIFLHLADTDKDPPSGTLGCTAMKEPQLLEVLRWLDPKKRPVLIEMPSAEYGSRRQTWRLP